MPKFDYLQDIDQSFLENKHITQSEYYKVIANIFDMFSNTKVYYNNNDYYLGSFSEVAINFFIDKKLDDIMPYFHELKIILDKVSDNNYEFNTKNIIKIKTILVTLNSKLSDLIIFNDKITQQVNLQEAYNFMVKTHKENDAFKAYILTLLISYILIADTIIDFYEVYFTFSKIIVSRKNKKSDESHFQSLDNYFNEDAVTENIGKNSKIFDIPMDRMTKSRSYFNIVNLPDNDDKTLVELIYFDDYSSLLQQDYFRALQAGHTIRLCKNCRRVFLQTTNQDTAYCDRLYLDTNQTCRSYGPIKFHKEKVENSPVHSAYNKCYRKIYMRHYRNSINDNEFNDLIAKINYYKDKTLSGQIEVIDYLQLLDDI